MEIRFTNQLSDFTALSRAIFPFLRIRTYAGWVGRIVLTLIPGTILLAVLQFWSLLILFWIGVGILTIVVILSSLRATKRMLDKFAKKLCVTAFTMRISPQTMIVENDGSWSQRLWSDVKDVRETPQQIFVLISKIRAFVIPKRDFASYDEAERFVAQIDAYRRSADQGGNQTIETRPLDDVLATVSYQNTAEQFVDVLFHGLVEPDQRRRQKSAIGWVLVILAILVCGALASGPVGATLAAALGFILAVIPSAILVARVNGKNAAKNIEPFQLQPHTLGVTPLGIIGATPTCIAFTRWQNFAEFKQSSQLVAVYDIGGVTLSYLIPVAAFPTSDLAAQFSGLVQSYWEEGNMPVSASLVVETGNPYQAPLQ